MERKGKFSSWPTRHRPFRWSLFSHKVRPFVCPSRYSAKTKHAKTKTLLQLYMESGGSLNSTGLFLLNFTRKTWLTSLANLKWPTRPQPVGSHHFQPWCLSFSVFCLPGPVVSVLACFCFSDGRTPQVNIMTTYPAVAWWIKKLLLTEMFLGKHIKLATNFQPSSI